MDALFHTCGTPATSDFMLGLLTAIPFRSLDSAFLRQCRLKQMRTMTAFWTKLANYAMLHLLNSKSEIMELDWTIIPQRRHCFTRPVGHSHLSQTKSPDLGWKPMGALGFVCNLAPALQAVEYPACQCSPPVMTQSTNHISHSDIALTFCSS